MTLSKNPFYKQFNIVIHKKRPIHVNKPFFVDNYVTINLMYLHVTL
ncbi:hypothetical protein SAMN06269250_5347 [Spirosoma fluviale]|uniref:Uncharacterized protein n=1 Tax=Spirosoma fluviale TaxID=1597977 RepID=A0A286GLY4_9BACT|nr:hypothetical protein SAMN06269250_5347 [Spirosoma fluviale]